MSKLSLFHDGVDSSTATVKSRLTAHLSHMVKSQVIAVGDQLPTTRELAELWGADVSTIHYALKELVRDGMIERVAGRGTFVRERARRLRSVGLYLESENLQTSSHTYKAQLAHEVRMVLRERNLREVTIVDHRPGDNRAELLPELLQVAQAGQVDGVVHLCGGVSGPNLQRWLPVPVASTGIDAAATSTAVEAFVELGMQHLAAKGRRQVGLIHEYPLPEIVQRFPRLARKHGLHSRPEWFITSHELGLDVVTGADAEQLGYRAFQQLWGLDDRPDGLLVFYDYTSRGVLMALGVTDCRVPAELELVLYRNEGLDYFCPYPAACVELGIHALAEQFIDKLEADLAGRPCAQPCGHTTLHLATAASTLSLVPSQ